MKTNLKYITNQILKINLLIILMFTILGVFNKTKAEELEEYEYGYDYKYAIGGSETAGFRNFYSKQGFFCVQPGEHIDETGIIFEIKKRHEIDTESYKNSVTDTNGTTDYAITNNETTKRKIKRAYVLAISGSAERSYIEQTVKNNIKNSKKVSYYKSGDVCTIETASSWSAFQYNVIDGTGFGTNKVDVSRETYPYAKYLQRSIKQAAIWLTYENIGDSTYIPFRTNSDKARIGNTWSDGYSYLKDATNALNTDAENFTKYIIDRGTRSVSVRKGKNGTKLSEKYLTVTDKNGTELSEKDLTVTDKNPKVEIIGDDKYVGPYVLGEPTGIVAGYYNSDGERITTNITTNTEKYIKDENGYTTLEGPVNGKEIYFKFANGANLNDQEIKFSTTKIDVNSYWYELQNDKSSQQNMIRGAGRFSAKSITLKLIFDQTIKLPEFTLIKTDDNGDYLDGAIFNAVIEKTDGTHLGTFENVSVEEGFLNIDLSKYSEAIGNINKFNVYITEVVAPAGYIKYNGTIELVFEKVNDDWKCMCTDTLKQVKFEFNDKENEIKLTVENEEIIPPKILLIKTDNNGDYVQNVKFGMEITRIDNGKEFIITDEVITNENGKIGINIKEYFSDIKRTDKYKIVLTELNVPNGYVMLNKTINLKIINSSLRYDINGDGACDNDDVVYIQQYNADKVELNADQLAMADVNNDGVVNTGDAKELLRILEANEHWVTIIENKEELNSNDKIIISQLTYDVNKDGIFNLDDAGYILEYCAGKIALTTDEEKDILQILHSNADKIINNDANTILNALENQGSIIKIINSREDNLILGGTVWLDEQTGDKPALESNGMMDSAEKRLGDIAVYLYKAEDNALVAETKTDSNGDYIFEKLESRNDYYVVFEYDGVNYEATKTSKKEILFNREVQLPTDSKAAENQNDRESFNAKFQTITGDSSETNTETKAYGKSSGEITLEYTRTTEGGTKEVPYKTKLLTEEDDGTVKDEFAMRASTLNLNNKYLSQSAIDKGVTEYLDINFGLVKRELDLSLNTFFEKAEVSINGKIQTYKDNAIIIDMNETQNEEKPSDLPILESDYNYRMRDYQSKLNDKVGGLVVNPEDDTEKEYKTGNELAIELTYRIDLNNESINGATINEVVNYYNSNLTLNSITYPDKRVTRLVTEVNSEIEGYKKTTINGLNSTLKYGERASIYLTFTVNKVDNKIILDEYKNIAEITSYSTSKGMIDIDSAPDDALVTSSILYEDDTNAGICIISIMQPPDDERTIAGYVWDDANKDGKKDEGEGLINDVIVQLVEVRPFKKDANGNIPYVEYIWQETKTGSETGARMSMQSNDEGDFYTEDYSYTKKDGYYEFKDFIPANYIIRFIYGDGTTYDLTSNVLKYNGQDYKSTIINNNATDSKAKDNEARRLETMAEFIEITPEKGVLLSLLDNTELTETEKQILIDAGFSTGDLEKLQKDILDKTWMCAETDSIEVPASINEGWERTDQYLGLAKRPATKLTLEKHLTGLKIQPNAVGVTPIADIAAKNEDILKWKSESTKEIGTGMGREDLTIVISRRNNRGSWAFETDIQYLMQGATLDATYVYTVKNESEEDYISKTLVDAYKNIENGSGKEFNGKTYKSYSEYLSAVSQIVKNNIKYKFHNTGMYLGEKYYTGETASNEEKTVNSIVKGIEESINPEMNLISTKNTDFIAQKEATQKTVYDTDGNVTQSATKIPNTTIKTKEGTSLLAKGESDTKTAVLSTTTSASDDLIYDSYIAQIMAYSNAAGRRDTSSTPGNLEYVHSDETGKTMENNEPDEAWAEQIKIIPPLGEDQSLDIQTIIIISVSGIVLIGVGIILIKKYVIK